MGRRQNDCPQGHDAVYMDISYNGVKYRAVALNEYRPYFTGYNINDNKTHQSINGYKTGNIYYFKFEPLVWRILDSEDGLVMCDKIIDSQAFRNVFYNYGGTYYCSESKYASNWEASSLRNWLLRTPVGIGAVNSVYITGTVDIKCTVGFIGSGIVPAMKLDFKSSCIQHSYIPSVTSPTCAERGYTTYTCSNCGHEYVTDYVDTLLHEFGE